MKKTENKKLSAYLNLNQNTFKHNIIPRKHCAIYKMISTILSLKRTEFDCIRAVDESARTIPTTHN